MPYSISDTSNLPANVRALSAKKQRQWIHVWNSTYSKCQNGGTNDRDDCESRAFASANSVVSTNKSFNGKAENSMPDTEEQEWLDDESIAFKKLSYQSKNNLPKSAYAYTDSQGKGHLPIHDLSHLRNAVARLGNSKTGKKWGLSDSARKSLQVRLQHKLGTAQHAYDEKIAHHLALFDLSVDKDGQILAEVPQDKDSDVVLRKGLLFRSGRYEDKDFELTPKELKKVAKEFDGPISLDSEHEHSIFDGKLGKLIQIKASKDGEELHGVVAIPKWLDPILMAAGGKVSAAFDRISKKLVGLALTINPRVSDAALMAAFTVDQATKGNLTIKELMKMAELDDKKQAKLAAKADDGPDDEPDDDDDDDDAQKKTVASKSDKKAAKLAAKKAKKAKKFTEEEKPEGFVGYDAMIARGGEEGQSGGAKFATRSGGRIMQRIHDITASRGAVCRIEPQPATKIGPYGIVRYASKDEMNVIQGIHDTTLSHGANCTPSLYGQQDVPDGFPWSWQWPGVTDEGYKGVPGDTKEPHFTRSKKSMSKNPTKTLEKFMASLENIDPRYSNTNEQQSTDDARRRDEELEKLRVENRRMRQQGIMDRAAAFAEKVIQAGHATPVERDGIITVHAQLEHDDTFTAAATFSNGMSRVSAYESSILARPNNLLSAELLPAGVQQGLLKFANMTETPKSGSTALPMSDDRKKHLTSLDPVLKNAFEANRKNGSNN